MFTTPLDALLFFTVTVPVVGFIEHKLGVKWLKEAYALAGFSASLYLLLNVYRRIMDEGILVVALYGSPPPLGACLEVDAFSLFMALIAVSLGLLSTVYSFRYMEKDTGLTLYYTLLLGMTAGVVGVSFAGDLLTLYVFWEVMCVTSYALVAFRREHWEPVEAGFKYLIMSSAGSATILLAMSLLYGMTGTLNLAYLAASLHDAGGDRWLLLPLALTIVGFGVKGAIVPLHTWAPDAYSAAPDSVSAILSGATTKMGVYGLLRLLFLVFSPIQAEWSLIVAILSVATMTLGNIIALLQTDIKRLMAYSSIAQIGYILIGLAVGNEDGLTGALFHIFNHSFMKGLAFLCAGALIYEVGSRELRDLTGIGRRMHLSAGALWVSFLSLIGFPPLSGFVSKFILFVAAIEANMAWLAIAGIANTILSAAYYLKVLHVITRSEISERADKAREAPISMLIPIAAMAAVLLVFGIWPESMVEVSRRAALCLLAQGRMEYVEAVVGAWGE